MGIMTRSERTQSHSMSRLRESLRTRKLRSACSMMRALGEDVKEH